MTTRSQMRAAMDAVLASRPELAAEARQARHRADFEHVWAQFGYPNDPTLKRRTFARLAPRFAAWDAREDLHEALAAASRRDEHRRRIEAARELGRAQGQALALRQQSAALLTALDRRVAAAERSGPVRPRLRFWRAGSIRMF